VARFGADRTEDVGPFVAGIAWCPRSRTDASELEAAEWADIASVLARLLRRKYRDLLSSVMRWVLPAGSIEPVIVRLFRFPRC
jgi:hypothetical protein